MKRSKTQLLRSLAAVMLLGAGLASCSQDDFADNRQGEPLPPGEYPLILNAGGLEAVATPAQQSAPSTRGTVDSDWDGVKSVAVMVNGKVKEYKVMRSGTDNKTAKLEVVDGDTPFYWESTAALAVEAWWPCTDKSNNFSDEEPAVVVQADQNKDDGYAKSDFIKAIDNVEFDNPTLTFTHLTAKVIVNLTWDKGFSEEEMNSAAISFINLNTQDGNPETITPFADKTKNTYFALLAGQEIEANKGFIQVSIGSGSSQRQYVYTPTAAKKLDKGVAYTYEITVRQTGLDVTVNESISWDEEGAEGSGSVDLTTFVLDNNDDRTFELSDGDEITVKGNGSQSKGKLTFKVPTGSTATVNLEEINIINSATGVGFNLLFNIIQIEGGGKVIFNLIGTNTIELNAELSVWSSVAICAYDSDIEITGGRLEIKGNGDAVIVAHGGGNITINETAIYMNYMGNYASRLPCIGSGAYTTCGEIVIYKSDVEINYKSATMYLSGIAPAIGPCKNGGKCGDVTITLKDGQTKSNFLDKITLTDKEGTTFSDGQKVIYGPGITTDQYGTLTWLDSAGKPITE